MTRNWKSVSAFCLCIVAFSVLLAGCSGNATASTPNFGSVPTTTALTTAAAAANALVSVVTSASTVNPGDNFDVSIQITTDTPARQLQCILTWDPTQVKCNSVEQGGFFTSLAQQNNMNVQVMPSPLNADNKIGKFPPGNDVQGTIQYAETAFLIGGTLASDNTLPGAEGTGVVFVLHMTANSDASGIVAFKLADVGLGDNSETPKALNPTVYDGQITISGTK